MEPGETAPTQSTKDSNVYGAVRDNATLGSAVNEARVAMATGARVAVLTPLTLTAALALQRATTPRQTVR